MLVSKIIKFKQLIFLPLFVLFYSMDLKISSQSSLKLFLTCRFAGVPTFRVLTLRSFICTYTACCHGAWPVSSPVQPLQGWAGSYQAERGRVREPLRLSAEPLPNPCKVYTGGYGILTQICHLSSPGCLHP